MTEQHPQEPSEQTRKPKARARSRGEGSVFKRSGENRQKPWVAQITLETGKKSTVGYFKTEAEAIAARNKALRDLEQGIRVAHSRKTVGEYLDYWLEHVQKPNLEQTSYVNYRSALDSRLIPAFGHIPIQKLTTHQIQMYYSQLISEEGLKASSVRSLHNRLHSALAHAVRENLVARNVCDGVKLPRKEKGKRQALTPEQATQLLKAAEDSQMQMIMRLAVVATLRRGELLALHWEDVDFTARRIQIRRSLAYISRRGLIEKSPKTDSSEREIAIPLFVVESLKEHQSQQQEKRRLAGDAWQEHDLVFCNNVGKHIHPTTLDRWFKELLVAANLPQEMHLHDLRHSAVTILLKMGVPPHVVQEIAGHSDISTTLGIYGHVLPGQQKQEMDKWDGVLGDQAEERYARMQQQWSAYNAQVQEPLEELLKRYGEGAVWLALDAIKALR
jgi:integrase